MEDAMREYLEAMAEHERALAAVAAVQEQLARARTEYADARHAEQQSEQELQSAVAQVAAGLHELHVSEESGADDATSTVASEGHSSSNEATAATATLPLHAVPEDSAAVASASQFPAIATSLVEYHRNIGCYHCYLFLDSAAADSTSSSSGGVYGQVDASQLSVYVAFPHVQLRRKRTKSIEAATTVSEDASDALWWTTEIERNVEQANCVVTVKSDHIHVRLPVRIGDKDISTDAFASFSQIIAQELDVRHYRSIACRACANALVNARAPDDNDASPGSSDSTTPMLARVLPLPSANWTDMFDFWGAGLGAFEHLPREDILAQRTRVYVGESHLLLHLDDTVAAALVRAQADDNCKGTDDNDADWMPLSCGRCAAVLGLQHREHAETVHLDKHTLARGTDALESQDDDIFARYTIDSVVCAKILEVADADGVFRFTLRPYSRDGSSEPLPAALVLQLLSWETQAKATDARAFRRVLKVLYAPDKNSSSSSHSHEGAGPAAPHDLIVAPVVYDAVITRLHVSSELLPRSLRTFNSMNVGYLYA